MMYADEPIAVLCIVLIAMLPLAPAGLALLNTGLGRSRSAAQSLMGAMLAVSVSAIVFCVIGFSFAGFQGMTSYSLSLGSAQLDWIGATGLFFSGLHWDGSLPGYAAAFEVFAVGLAAIIPWGAGADRWRLRAVGLASVLIGGLLFPLFAHWVWGGGWLSALGTNFQIGAGFMDPGGAATIQAFGGLTALVAVWLLGPRNTKFAGSSVPRAIPGHHMIFVLFGCMLMLPGWLAFNLLGATLFAGTTPQLLVPVAINTLLCAAMALMAALFITRIRFGKPDVSLCANGWVAGLVTSSAVAAFATPAEAMIAGTLIGGALPWLVELLEVHARIDDPSGAVVVHGVAGLWGLFALGFMGAFPPGQMLAQLIGIGTLLGLMLPMIYGCFWLLNKVFPFRTSPEGEQLGMDLHELGAGAYPEFVIYGDDFLPR
ncbi:MAG: ammonium transporter [Acidobacteriaceae bacterium]